MTLPPWVRRAPWTALTSAVIAALVAMGFTLGTPQQRWRDQAVTDARQDTTLARYMRYDAANRDSIFVAIASQTTLLEDLRLTQCTNPRLEPALFRRFRCVDLLREAGIDRDRR
jgi:hypothetical protein